MPPPFRVGNLGEIALRCRDYPAMVAFYRDVIGLTVLAVTRTAAETSAASRAARGVIV